MAPRSNRSLPKVENCSGLAVKPCNRTKALGARRPCDRRIDGFEIEPGGGVGTSRPSPPAALCLAAGAGLGLAGSRGGCA